MRELENKHYTVKEQYDNLRTENERLREENQKSREEVRLLELRYEEKVRSLEYQLNERDTNEKLTLEKVLTEHSVNVRELNREWEGRLEEIESKMRAALNAKEDLEIELQKVLDSVDIIEQEHALEVKDLVERIKDEEYSKYEEKVAALTARISALEQARDESRRNMSDEVMGI